MGGGKAIRRRAKLMERANQGNLHKAARGRASAHLPLPPAPSKDDYKEKLPASLAKIMALKEAIARPVKKQKQEAGAEAPKQQHTRQPSLQQLQGQQQQQPAQQHQPDSNTKAGASSAAAGGESKQPALLWEQPKKLKQRKKEYLNAKKLKKKAGKKGLANQEVALVDKPAFGEVVHEPPKVQLKRKHWDPVAAAAEAEAAGKRSSSSIQQRQQKQKEKQGSKPAKKKLKQDSAMQELREQAIESYRAGRGPREGHATLNTLKKLVQ